MSVAEAVDRRSVPGVTGYFVDADARVWDLRRGERLVATHLHPRGYLRVLWHGGGACRPYFVHRLVCLAFHGIPAAGQMVRHLDGNKLNNHPSNLAWGTAQENSDDSKRHGVIETGDQHSSRRRRDARPRGDRSGARLHPERLARGDRNGARLHPERIARGERQGSARLTDALVREIRALAAQGLASAAIAKQIGVVRPRTIRSVVSGERWRHVE